MAGGAKGGDDRAGKVLVGIEGRHESIVLVVVADVGGDFLRVGGGIPPGGVEFGRRQGWLVLGHQLLVARSELAVLDETPNGDATVTDARPPPAHSRSLADVRLHPRARGDLDAGPVRQRRAAGIEDHDAVLDRPLE
jgi:hypothetical protein